MPDLTLILPLPDPVLSPNAGGMRNPKRQAQRRRAVRDAKEMIICAVLEQRPRGEPLTKATVTVTFTVPDKRTRDKGNLITSAKAYLDGLTLAGVIKDDAWRVIDEVYPLIEYRKGVSETRIEVTG